MTSQVCPSLEVRDSAFVGLRVGETCLVALNWIQESELSWQIEKIGQVRLKEF